MAKTISANIIGSGDFALDSSGLLAGGQIGYNWQADQFVFGAEADFQWTGLEGDIDADIESGIGGLRTLAICLTALSGQMLRRVPKLIGMARCVSAPVG